MSFYDNSSTKSHIFLIHKFLIFSHHQSISRRLRGKKDPDKIYIKITVFFVKNWFYSKQFEYFLITKNSTNIQIYLYKGSHVLLGGKGVNSGGFFVGFFLFVSIQVWKSLAFHMKCLLITLSSCWTLQFCIKVFVLTL